MSLLEPPTIVDSSSVKISLAVHFRPFSNIPSGTGAAGHIKAVARQGLGVKIVDEADLLHDVLQDVERRQAVHTTTVPGSRVSIPLVQDKVVRRDVPNESTFIICSGQASMFALCERVL
jgi:hypothetical protein